MAQVYAISTYGGNWTVPFLSEKLRHVAQPMFALRQFCDPKDSIGKGKGDTYNFDKAGNVATQGGTLTETLTIPNTSFLTNQGTVTITEYGNSIDYTGKLAAMGQFEIEPVAEQKLRDDQVKVLESAAGAQFAATDFYAVCTTNTSVTFTTNGTATASATGNLTASNVRAIADYMKKKLIPKYNGREYICVASTAALSGMHSDTATGGWADLSKYTPTYAANLFNGEVGSFYGVRFIEETGYLSNTIGNGSAYGQAVMFGADSVIEAVSIPEEIRVKAPQDYGRDLGVAWYALLGFKIVWNYATDGEQHVVFVTSA